MYSFEMFKLNSHVVIGDGENCQPLILNLILIFRQKKFCIILKLKLSIALNAEEHPHVCQADSTQRISLNACLISGKSLGFTVLIRVTKLELSSKAVLALPVLR